MSNAPGKYKTAFLTFALLSLFSLLAFLSVIYSSLAEEPQAQPTVESPTAKVKPATVTNEAKKEEAASAPAAVSPAAEVQQETVASMISEAKKEEAVSPAEPAHESVTLDFSEADIRNVLKIIAYKSGVNIVATPEVIGNVTIRLVDVPWEKALDTIVKTYGFGYEWLSEKVLLVSTLEKLAQQRKSQQAAADMEPLDTKTFTLNFSRAEDIKKAIEKLVSSKGKITVESRTNNVIINDSKSNLIKLGEIIKELDKITPQVMIEAKIIETTLGTSEKLGVDWTLKIAAGGSKRPTTWPFRVWGSDQDMYPVPESERTYTRTWNPDTLGYDEAITINTDFPVKPSVPTTFDELNNLQMGTFPMATADQFTFGTLDFSQFKAVLEVLNSRSDTKVISNPRITTLNNQEAKILVGTIVPIPVYAFSREAGTTIIKGYENLEVGIKLQVTPYINEQQFISLIIKPNVEAIIGWTGPNNERPIISTRGAEAKVMIKDGQTLVMGGLISENKIKSTKKVPILGDIPILSYIFSKKEDSITRTDLLIFITPHIIQEGTLNPEEVTKFEQKLDSVFQKPTKGK